MPENPSIPACTPGISCMVFSTSASPKRVGVCWITVTGTSIALILVERMPASLVATTVALLSCRSGLRVMFMVVSLWRSTSID